MTQHQALTEPLTETVILTFRGQIAGKSFADFARHRAAKLSLALDLMDQTIDLSRMRVSGHPVLVNAFELALSLGPQDCLVRDVERGNA
jgi:hypothetical protein